MGRIRVVTWERVLAGLIAISVTAACARQGQMQEAAAEPRPRTTCIDIPAGSARPEFGCFNIATLRGLRFKEPFVYWHLRVLPNRAAAEAARSPTGLVVEEQGRVWLSELAPRDANLTSGEPVAIVGPLQLPRAETFNAVLSFAVMQPGDRSMIHTHPGPEGWYLLAGEQCIQTPSGSVRTAAGETVTTAPDVPIELHVTGTTTRRALLVVIHDAAKPRTLPSSWQPPAVCGD
jgi:quercetin dioxygenase-like cupin family protein